jgi:hypothetical protein
MTSQIISRKAVRKFSKKRFAGFLNDLIRVLDCAFYEAWFSRHLRRHNEDRQSFVGA